MSHSSLAPNSIIGILGDGQLGRMMALAAAQLGYGVHVFGQVVDSPAAQVARANTIARYDDKTALAKFANAVDTVTLEFENVPVETIKFLSHHVPVHPSAEALATTQDRRLEKIFLKNAGFAVADFAFIASVDDLKSATERIGPNGILKTTRFGYDGKGQVRIKTTDDLNPAFAAVNGAPAIYEAFVPFEREISVVVARGQDGTVAPFDVSDNVHRNHILHTASVPSTLAPTIAGRAKEMASVIANRLKYVGVMAVEFFVLQDGALLVNEIAPRPHNSGHWTMNACAHDQFSQAIRAVAGLTISPTVRHSDVVMTNLIGDAVNSAHHLARNGNVALHLYGKSEIKPGRKMGHYNTISARC